MAQPKSSSRFILDIEDGVAILTLNRPEKMNAFTGQDDVRDDRGVRYYRCR